MPSFLCQRGQMCDDRSYGLQLHEGRLRSFHNGFS